MLKSNIWIWFHVNPSLSRVFFPTCQNEHMASLDKICLMQSCHTGMATTAMVRSVRRRRARPSTRAPARAHAPAPGWGVARKGSAGPLWGSRRGGRRCQHRGLLLGPMAVSRHWPHVRTIVTECKWQLLNGWMISEVLLMEKH